MAFSRSIARSFETFVRYAQHGSGSSLRTYVIPANYNNIRPLLLNQCHKATIQKITSGKLLKDPRILLSVSQSTDASELKESQVEVVDTPVKDVTSEEEAVEYDKLYRLIRVECRGNDKAVLRSYSQFVEATANHLQITLESMEFPKHHIRRWTLLKSIFVHKKHRVQYEVRTSFLIMRFLRLTSSTADTFLEYIQRNLPEGVSMIVTKEELMKLPKYIEGSDKVAPRSE